MSVNENICPDKSLPEEQVPKESELAIQNNVEHLSENSKNEEVQKHSELANAMNSQNQILEQITQDQEAGQKIKENTENCEVNFDLKISERNVNLLPKENENDPPKFNITNISNVTNSSELHQIVAKEEQISREEITSRKEKIEEKVPESSDLIDFNTTPNITSPSSLVILAPQTDELKTLKDSQEQMNSVEIAPDLVEKGFQKSESLPLNLQEANAKTMQEIKGTFSSTQILQPTPANQNSSEAIQLQSTPVKQGPSSKQPTKPDPNAQRSRPPKPNVQGLSESKKVELSMEELKKWGEQAQRQKQIIKEKEEEIEQLKKRVEFEKEGLLDRNKNLQSILDSFKDRFEKARKTSINLEFRNVELTKEIQKIEEEMSFYKEEVRAKFNLEVRIAELTEEISSLRAFKKEALGNDLNVRLKELQTLSANLTKQNELLCANNQSLENSSKKYINLCEQRAKEINLLKTELSRSSTKIEDLVLQTKSLQGENRELEGNLANKSHSLELLKLLRQRESKALKAQVEESDSQVKTLEQQITALRAELNKIIENIRKTPVSGIETGHSPSMSSQSREEKIILESLVSKNRELESSVRELERESRRSKVQAEALAEKLEAKEQAFLELAGYLQGEVKEEGQKGNVLTEAESKRINNAKFNKSVEDMRDLIGRVILENIQLKKQIFRKK